MKNRYLSSFVLFVLLVGASLVSSAQTLFYVSPDGFGGSGTIDDPTDFQSALDLAAIDNDHSFISLLAGTYTSAPYIYNSDPGSVGMNLTIRGGFEEGFGVILNGTTSVIDGLSLHRCLDINANFDGMAFTVSIFGLTLQNGNVNAENGAGLRFLTSDLNAMQLNIYDCFFSNNMATGNGSGGAIYTNTNTSVYTSSFAENEAYNGGAIFSARIIGNTDATNVYVIESSFTGNENYGNQGSTIWTNANFILGQCIIEGEEDGSSSGAGSAIWGNPGSVLTVRTSVFRDLNIDYWGSAIQAFDGDIYASNSLFENNTCGLINGYGVITYFHNNGTLPRMVSVLNCTFRGNSSDLANWASCVHYRGDNNDLCTIVNSIFSDNATTPVYAETGSGNISYSYIDSGYDGFVNGGSLISGDAGFVSDTDSRLMENSICRNVGNNDLVDGAYDLAKGIRLLGSNIDLGCYEYNYAPTDIGLSSNSVFENAGGMDFFIGLLNTVEDETGDVFSYELVPGDGVNDADNNLFYPSDGALYMNTVPDFETKPSYSIYLRSTDSYGQTFSKAFVIDVIDVNEAPTATNGIPDQEAIVSQPYFYEIPSDMFVDPDAGDVLTIIAFQENGSALPTWLSFDGTVFSGTPLSPDNLSIKVRAMDVGQLFVDVLFDLDVLPTGVDELVGANYKMYPIPARDFLNIEVSGRASNEQANFVDANGKIVCTVWLFNGRNTIDVSQFSRGVYTIQYGHKRSVSIVIE